MRYKNIILGILGMAILTGITSCKKQMDNLLNNPNYPAPSTADVDLYLNQVQLSFNNFYAGTPNNLANAHYNASDLGAQLTRQQSWTGPFYRNGYTPASYDNEWIAAYASDPVYATNTGVLNNMKAMIPLAQAQKKYVHSGIARILTAYTLGTLVDQFGDVPYSESGLGTANTSPKVDPGATAYASVQTLLDSAIADLQKTGGAAGPTNDLFYPGGSSTNGYHAANWVTLAKTLKLKYYMQVRLVDNSVVSKIQDLLTENDLINKPSQDFTFRYGTSLTSPDSRHPHYGLDYVQSGGVGEYISNYYMWMIASQKYGGAVNFKGDPRLRYYFYRQAKNYTWANSQTCPCFVRSQFGDQTNFPAWYPSVPDQTPYCLIGNGYMGRDHGDNSGAPPDGAYRTAWGVYPAGGEFDADKPGTAGLGIGGQGAGINPIWLSSFTAFLEAEAALTLGISTQGDARTLLKNSVTASINKVMAFPTSVGLTPDATKVPDNTQVTNYINLVLSNYDAAASDDARLNIIMTEYYLALWGNGVESYNNYRRTGKPDNMQIAVAVPNPGHFMRSFYYPAVYVNRNSNAPAQKSPGDAVNKVFWDNNPDDFIK